MTTDGMKILIGKPMDCSIVERIKKRFPSLELVMVDSEDQQEELIHDADILVTRRIPDDISAAPRLKWVQFLWEGVDQMTSTMRSSDIILTNASGIHSVQMAEHVFGLLLNLNRKGRMYMQFQERREWLPWPEQPKLDTLSGSTMGIMGYGRIGKAIARIANGFDMKIMAIKKHPDRKGRDDGPASVEIYGMDHLNQLLSRSDHVVVALPLTEETRGLMGRQQFHKMKEDANFINVGRGPIVDEAALIESLDQGRIKGAGLDVFTEEPLPSSSPLWSMDNVVITPHSSVGGDPAEREVMDLFMDNLERFLRGDGMINVIDKGKGY